jgi:hypothetical protein
MTREEVIVFLEAIKRGLHQTGKDHPYRDDLIPKMKEALCIAIEELKAEPCKDAISREAALEAILTRVPDFCGSDECGNLIYRNETASYIRNLPSVTPKLKTGKWNVLGYDDPSVRMYKCSECHMKITLKFNYCPNCGAKMENPE